MINPTYPIKYDAPEGHVLHKASVPPESAPATQGPARELPLAGVTQKYPLGG